MFDVNQFFFELILQAGPRVGDAWNYAIWRYYPVHSFEKEYDRADWNGLAEFHQAWKFMLFGDPSLRIGGGCSAVSRPDLWQVDHLQTAIVR